MWASRRKTEEARPQIRNGGVDGGNPLINRMPATAPPARITGIYRYPVKGLTPELTPRVRGLVDEMGRVAVELWHAAADAYASQALRFGVNDVE